jgi:hypothetical protein
VRLLGVRRPVHRGAPPSSPEIDIVNTDRIHKLSAARRLG